MTYWSSTLKGCKVFLSCISLQMGVGEQMWKTDQIEVLGTPSKIAAPCQWRTTHQCPLPTGPWEESYMMEYTGFAFNPGSTIWVATLNLGLLICKWGQYSWVLLQGLNKIMCEEANDNNKCFLLLSVDRSLAALWPWGRKWVDVASGKSRLLCRRIPLRLEAEVRLQKGF